MKAAEHLQNNSTVEVEPFTFFYTLNHTYVAGTEVRSTEIGNLKVQGFATRSKNPLGEEAISVEVQWVKFGVDVKPVLIHFNCLEQIEAAALRHAKDVVFAPRATAESVLSAIIETVYALKEHEPLTFITPITIRLSDLDHDLVQVAGLCVTHKRELIVLQGDGTGDRLEAADANADRMIAGLYQGLQKLFPHYIKAIA